MKLKIILILSMLTSFDANAVWLTVTGKVKNISTYSSTETILVNLDSHGTAVEDCTNTTTFAISKTISSEARARMYALLLAAKSSNSSVTIAFNDVGNCEPWDANQNAYRIITRING